MPRTCFALVVSVLCLVTSSPLRAQNPQARGRVSQATFEGGRYRHAVITFDVPEEWRYGGTAPAEDPLSDTAHWTDPASGVSVYVWMNRSTATTEDIRTLMANAVANKTRQRAQQGYANWVIRPASIRQDTVDGHPALTAVADFARRDGTSRIERLTWVFAPQGRALFFATMGPEQLAAAGAQFDRIVTSAVLP